MVNWERIDGFQQLESVCFELSGKSSSKFRPMIPGSFREFVNMQRSPYQGPCLGKLIIRLLTGVGLRRTKPNDAS